MEVFPRDIWKLLLWCVADGGSYVYRLRHLSRVNRLWRRRVSRYLVETTNKEWFLDQMLVDKMALHMKSHFIEWNVFDALAQQWTSPLRGAFIMYLGARQMGNEMAERFRINYRHARKLFYTKHSVLRDVSKKIKQHEIVKMQNKHIRDAEDSIEKAQREVEKYRAQAEEHHKKRETAYKAIEELDAKWLQAKKSKQ